MKGRIARVPLHLSVLPSVRACLSEESLRRQMRDTRDGMTAAERLASEVLEVWAAETRATRLAPRASEKMALDRAGVV